MCPISVSVANVARGSMRLKRDPGYWEFRAYAGRDPITGRPRYVSRMFRGGKRSEVGPKDFDDFYDRLRSWGLSPSTVQRYHTLLGGAFLQAMKWGLASRNVVRLATPPAVPRQSLTVPTPEVVAALSALRSRVGLQRTMWRSVCWQRLALDAARCVGCVGRRSISMSGRSGFGTQSPVARLVSGELIEKDPKSHQTRQASIDPTTCQVLRDHHDYQLSVAAQVGCALRSDAFVIADLVADPTGGVPVRPDRLTQAFKRLTDRVPGAADVRLHDLRHWYATTQRP